MNKSTVTGIILMNASIVCKTCKCGKLDIKVVEDDTSTYIDINVTRNYDDVKENLFVRYDSELLYDGQVKCKVTGDSKYNIRIYIEFV